MVDAYLRWTRWRAALHRGWWLVTSVYLVVDAGLSPPQLVLVGVAQALVGLVCEVPAGVVADTLGRKRSLIVSQLLMGAAMTATALVTGFVPVLLTQMLWGLAWTFASGADVAWITDELADPERIATVLTRAGRADLTGAATGMIGLGLLASVTGRSAAMAVAGLAQMVLAGYILRRFPERRFAGAGPRWAAFRSVLTHGVRLTRRSRPILVMMTATLLVNGALVAGRLLARRLVDLGFPTTPLVAYTGLGVAALLAGAAVLRAVEMHIDDARTARRGYLLACAAGALGLTVLALASGAVLGSAAFLLVTGVAAPVTRTLATIWVNRETVGAVRATVHSFLAQAEYLGVILLGLALAAVAGWLPVPGTLLACAGLFVLAAVVAASPDRRGACG